MDANAATDASAAAAAAPAALAFAPLAAPGFSARRATATHPHLSTISGGNGAIVAGNGVADNGLTSDAAGSAAAGDAFAISGSGAAAPSRGVTPNAHVSAVYLYGLYLCMCPPVV